MKYTLSESEIKDIIRNYYFDVYKVNVQIEMCPVIIDYHYEFVGDAIVKVSGNSFGTIILQNNDILDIINMSLRKLGYKAMDIKNLVTMSNGTLHIKGIELILNEQIKQRSR